MKVTNNVRLSCFFPRVSTSVVSVLMGALLVAGAHFVSAVAARAQKPEPQPPPEMSVDEPEMVVNEGDDAVAALHRMGAYLRTLKAFDVQAESTREEVLDDGQKLQFSFSTDLLVRVPDRMRAHVQGDDFERFYFYDAKTFTLWAPKMKYYARVPAPATLTELVDHLDQRFDMEMPLADLFSWGKDEGADDSSVTGAILVGESVVEGVACVHYAFRQEGLDWQIWIQKGDKPLPRKVVLTTLTDEARPQFSAIYTWDLAPATKDDAFVFMPPAGAVKVALARGDGSAADSQK